MVPFKFYISGVTSLLENIKRRMTCSMNMIKLLLIHFTFVVEKEPAEKRGSILGKDFQRICESSSGQHKSHLVLLFHFSSILHLPGETFVHDMIMM